MRIKSNINKILEHKIYGIIIGGAIFVLAPLVFYGVPALIANESYYHHLRGPSNQEVYEAREAIEKYEESQKPLIIINQIMKSDAKPYIDNLENKIGIDEVKIKCHQADLAKKQ